MVLSGGMEVDSQILDSVLIALHSVEGPLETSRPVLPTQKRTLGNREGEALSEAESLTSNHDGPERA